MLLVPLLIGAATAQVVPETVPKMIDSFCDFNRDFQLSASSALEQEFNYTLCMDVETKSYSITCFQGVPCPPGPNIAKAVYTGSGITYNVDWSGKCKKVACPASTCDPPDGMPFSFILLDDDQRGVAKRVGSTTLDGSEVDHYMHVRGPGMVMNWYTRNVSTAADQPKQLVRNSFNHSIPGQPAGVGVRDFAINWTTPAPQSSFAVPAACSGVQVAGDTADSSVWARDVLQGDI